jgi:hypothetical protein
MSILPPWRLYKPQYEHRMFTSDYRGGLNVQKALSSRPLGTGGVLEPGPVSRRRDVGIPPPALAGLQPRGNACALSGLGVFWGDLSLGLKPISLHTNSSGQGGRNLVPNT